MASHLKKTLEEDIKAALRAQKKELLGTLRLLLAAIKQREIDERIELDDGAILKTIDKMIKQRRESIRQYEAGNRPKLAEKERQEIAVLEAYLPKPLTETEIEQAIQKAFEETKASSIKDMGKVMGILQRSLAGRAEMSTVSAKVRERLNK